MRKILSTLSIALAITGAASAQQVGDANRNFTINGAGSNAASLVNDVIAANGGATTYTYATTAPNTNVFWLGSANANVGQLVLLQNSVDIGTAALGFADVGVIADGNGPGFPAAFFKTGPLGSFTGVFPSGTNLIGGNLKMCFGHLSQASMDGVFLSQVHNVTWVQDPNLPIGNATPNAMAAAVAAGDDTSTLVNLGWTFKFYNVNYTQMYAGSNGYLTSAANTGYVESVATMNSATGGAKICAWWDDLYVQAGSSLQFYTDNVGYAELTWVNVPEFVTVGANSFKITLTPGQVTLDYGAMSALDGLVGLSPGTGGVSNPLNLSIAPTALPGTATSAPNELFLGTGGVTNNDLVGYKVTFVLDVNGYPIVQS